MMRLPIYLFCITFIAFFSSLFCKKKCSHGGGVIYLCATAFVARHNLYAKNPITILFVLGEILIQHLHQKKKTKT